MPNLPNDPLQRITDPAAINTDLPAGDSPSFSRIQPTDLVGPTAANRQHQAAEKRLNVIRDRVNKIIDLLNVIDDVMLRRDGSDQKDGTAGLTGDLHLNGHVIDGLPEAVASGQPVRWDEFKILEAIVFGLNQNPVSMLAAFPTATVPAGWLACDGTTYHVSHIEPAEGGVVNYPAGYNWGTLTALRQILGSTWGGDGINSFRVPDYRGRVIVGSGIGFVGGVLSPRGIGQYGGEEQHTLNAAEVAPHTHWALSRQNRYAAAWSLSLGHDTWAASMSGAGQGQGDEKYNIDNATIAPTSGRTSAGNNATDGPAQGPGGQPHNNMQPFATALICIKY